GPDVKVHVLADEVGEQGTDRSGGQDVIGISPAASAHSASNRPQAFRFSRP
ncbi:MAG: hypothetical protein QOJ19_1242, partial [Acidimicrobiia bacterium]|nr:hypothetical protein [Acidimicrobiia bacterium]